jgi:serine/threonine protein kinase
MVQHAHHDLKPANVVFVRPLPDALVAATASTESAVAPTGETEASAATATVTAHDPERWRVALVDAGNVVALDAREGTLPTWSYCPPEHLCLKQTEARALPKSHAADAWSLGCLLLELLTGEQVLPVDWFPGCRVPRAFFERRLALADAASGGAPSTSTAASVAPRAPAGGPRPAARARGDRKRDERFDDVPSLMAAARPLVPPDFFELLQALMSLAPSERPTPMAALTHPTFLDSFGTLVSYLFTT